jgi:hypothetical protein
MKLYLVVNVIQCKQGVLWPQSESDWQVQELDRLLHLIGGVSQSARFTTYEDAVNTLLDRLDRQEHQFYAIYRTSPLVLWLDAGSTQIRNGQLEVDELAPTGIITGKHPSCDQIWQQFLDQLRQRRSRRPVRQVAPPDKVRQIQQEMRRLRQEKVDPQCQYQLQEARNIIRTQKQQLSEVTNQLRAAENRAQVANQSRLREEAFHVQT